MFVSLVLEVALALVAVYAGVGLASSVLAEWLATWLRWRPKFLDSGIKALLGNAQGADGQPLAESFGEAPLVRSLQQGSRLGARGPGSSYLPAWAFTETVLGMIRPPDWRGGDLTFNDFVRQVQHLPESELRSALHSLGRASDHDMGRVRANLDAWFEEVMDRVSGAYKRRMTAVCLAISLGLCWILGADAIGLMKTVRSHAMPQDSSPRIGPSPEPFLAPPPKTPAEGSPAASGAGPGPGPATSHPTAASPEDRPVLRLSVPATSSRPVVPATDWSQFLRIDLVEVGSHSVGLGLGAIASTLAALLWFALLVRAANFRLTGPPPRRRLAEPISGGSRRGIPTWWSWPAPACEPVQEPRVAAAIPEPELPSTTELSQTSETRAKPRDRQADSALE